MLGGDSSHPTLTPCGSDEKRRSYEEEMPVAPSSGGTPVRRTQRMRRQQHSPRRRRAERPANTIVVGIAQDLDNSLDPHKTVKAGTREVMFNVFEGLMKPTPEGDLTPAIASDYQVSEDRLTYTFPLRDGVKFHNGDTVTAEDVVYSIQRCAAATETGIVPVEAFSNITDIQAPDASTVVITLAQPDNEFLSYMTTAHSAGGLRPAGHRSCGHRPLQVRLPGRPGFRRAGEVRRVLGHPGPAGSGDL